ARWLCRVQPQRCCGESALRWRLRPQAPASPEKSRIRTGRNTGCSRPPLRTTRPSRDRSCASELSFFARQAFSPFPKRTARAETEPCGLVRQVPPPRLPASSRREKLVGGRVAIAKRATKNAAKL